MIRPMKWHIYGDGYPLCWGDDQALEWETEEAARTDWELMNPYPEFAENIEFKYDILYYDGGYIDMTKYHIVPCDDPETPIKLEEK